VIDGGDRQLEQRAAIDAAPTAIAHHGAFERAFLLIAARVKGFTGKPAWRTREGDAVKSMS
jgi:hypothetical protein